MIRIISDSSTLYSIEEGKKKDIDIIPMIVSINDHSYKENEEIDTESVLKMISEGHMPITSQPSVGEVIDMYNKYPNDEIINISMGDGLSGTYNTANVAKNMVSHSDKITVIDSKTLCAPHRYMVETAASMALQGKSKDDIVRTIEDMTSCSFLIPMDIGYLARGGRISHAAGVLGKMIKIVPVMTLAEDKKKLCRFTITKTFNSAINKICNELKSHDAGEGWKVYIVHALEFDLAKTAQDIIKDKLPHIETEVRILGPAMTSHGGPGCVAIQAVKLVDFTN